MATQDLTSHDLWWNGPKFLQTNNEWPTSSIELPPGLDLEERKVHVLSLNVIKYTDFVNNCSSLRQLRRVTAYGLRFIRNLRENPERRQLGYLRSFEQQAAIVFWIKATQASTFTDEYSRLMTSKEITSRSKLLSLQTFRDEDGLLRVGGRLKNALINYDEKHPIILQKNHALTDLIIQ